MEPSLPPPPLADDEVDEEAEPVVRREGPGVEEASLSSRMRGTRSAGWQNSVSERPTSSSGS